MNTASTSRRTFIAASGATIATVGFVRFPGDAAEFEYRYAHAVPLNNPMHVYLVRVWDDIRRKTNGRLNVQVFGANTLGGDVAILSQVRAGAIQFIMASGGLLSSLDLPAAAAESVGFAFRDEKQFLKTLDGPLGAYIRSQVEAKGLVIYPNPWSIGPRAITTEPRPIVLPDDFLGLKLRVSPAKIVFDLFSTLGAIPTQMESSAVYSGLQTHIIDGNEQAVAVFYDTKLFEVQKYLSLTSHMCASQWVVANPQAIDALPPDIRTIISTSLAEAVVTERAAALANADGIVGKLKDSGMVVNSVDPGPMRAKLKPYYARCQQQMGDTAWSLLEASVGKLG